MFEPLMVAVRPGGMLDWVQTLTVPVPPLTGMTPLKPDWFTVHWFAVSDPTMRGALIVRLQVVLAVAPAASTTLAWTLNVPVAVGVPLTVMVLPLSAALRPEGR